VNNTGRSVASFLVGFGIGAAVALLLAPQSGEETREWIADTADKKVKFLRRKGQQSIDHLQEAIALSGEKVAKIMKSSKNVFDSVSAKLD
jgi:gas vesicle protein